MSNKKIEVPKQGRRKFLGKMMLAGASFTILPRYVLGGKGFTAPSDKITLGYIGAGKLANNTLAPRFLNIDEVQVVAGCDVDQQKLDRFVKQIDDFYSEKKQTDYKGCKGYADFKELLTRPDIDAVVIATPDHWHAIPTVQAARANKHIYCEKPLSHTIAEGKAMVKAVRDNGRVLQTGSMQRSWEDFRRACELVRNGYIGDIKHIKVTVGGPPVPCDLPEQPTPAYLNWESWIGPAMMRPYNEVLSPPIAQTHFPRWRDYKEFGGGGMADWGAHMFDIAQWGLGMDRSGPVEITPPGNGVEFLTYKYENGVEMTHEDFGKGNAVRFEGTEGDIEVSRSFLNLNPTSLETVKIKSSDEQLYHSENHYQDWIDSIKAKKDPICDVETGHRTATVCYLGNIAYELKRPLKWNPDQEMFIGDEQANSMQHGPLRSTWKYFV